MVVVSKEIFKIAENEVCYAFIHPNYTCAETWSYIFWNSLPGCFKFYASIYILELLVNHRKINKKYLKKQMIYFIKSWIYALTMTNIVLPASCTIRQILGKFYYLTCIFLPGIFSGAAIVMENSRNRKINTILFSELAMECGVNYLKGQDIIKNSIVTDTLFFMINNAVFLHLYKTNALAKKASLIWFFDPRPKTDNKKTEHVPPSCCYGNKHKCLKHILKEGVKYFGTGYAFHFIKGMIAKYQIIVNSPLHIFSMIANKKAFYNGLFFGTYVFIYKVVCKYLYEVNGEETNLHNLLAGFLSGIFYCMSPNLQMNLLPPTLTLQLLWMNLQAKYKIPNWYFQEMWFAICVGILYHFRFLKPNYTPKYVTNMVSMVTNGK